MAGEKQSEWTATNTITLALAFVSVIIAGVTLYLSIIATETREAVGNLAKLAEESKTQSQAMLRQVEIANAQTGHLARQAKAASEQAVIGQQSAAIAQGELLTAQASLTASNSRAAAQTMYQMRLEAMATYIRGHADYEAALWEIRNRLPVDIENTDRVNQLTLAELEKLRETVDPIIAANQAAEAAFRASVVVWPATLRSLMVDAGKHGQKIGDCYEQASIRALNEFEAAQVRSGINAKCRNLGYEADRFEDASTRVYVVMAREVYKAARRAGANPESATEKLVDTWTSAPAGPPHAPEQ